MTCRFLKAISASRYWPESPNNKAWRLQPYIFISLEIISLSLWDEGRKGEKAEGGGRNVCGLEGERVTYSL